MTKPLLTAAFLLLNSLGVNAQVGVRNIGISNPGIDSLKHIAIGKAFTPKCPLPGSCGNGCAVYAFIGSGLWSLESNWQDYLVPPVMLSGCFEIIINPAAGSECILNVPLQIVPPGTKITVMAGKKFRLPGNLVMQQL